MSYDLVLVGGSGAQFGYALLECLGHGLVEFPNAIFVVDGDRGFFDKVLTPAAATFGQSAVDVANATRDAEGSETRLPKLRYIAPYSNNHHRFTITDLCGLNPLGALGEVCITQAEAAYPIDEGLYGMAKLGGVVVAQAGSEHGDTAPSDPHAFPSNLIAELASASFSGGGLHPVLVVGSVAGGTGAGFMAPLLKALRADAKLNSRPIHVFAFLPWFALSATKDGIGPSNQRMALNASQGILYLQKCIADLSAKPMTYVHLVGLPKAAKAPARSGSSGEGGMHQPEPGPLMYYVASLLSDRLRAFTNVADNMPTGVYTLLCNAAAGGNGPLAGRIRYRLPAVGSETSDEYVPFEALQGLLEAVVAGLATLSDKERYERCFVASALLSDDPERIPRMIYDAIRNSGADSGKRRAMALEVSDLLKAALAKTKKDLERLSSVLASISGTTQTDKVFVIDDWTVAALADPNHLQKVLARSGTLPKYLSAAAKQQKPKQFADLLVRALIRNLGRGPEGATVVAVRDRFAPAVTTDVTLPGTGLPNAKPHSEGSPFVLLSPAFVDDLARTITGNAQPDSQCLPSPLARAHVADFMISNLSGTLPDGPALADTASGRLLLMWLGITATKIKIGERIHLQQPDSPNLKPFEIIVKRAELASGPKPFRGEWVSILRETDSSKILGATSPRVGVFVGAGVDEGPTADKAPFQAIAQQIDAWNAWEPLKQIYRVFLSDVAAKYPDAVNMPWFALLRTFARFTPGQKVSDDDRAWVAEWAWYSVGPIPLQISGKSGENGTSNIADVWLPVLLEPAMRQSMVCALVGTAEQSYLAQPVAWIQVVDGDATLVLQDRSGPVEMLRIIAPTKFSGSLSPVNELRSGAFELSNFAGLANLSAQLAWTDFQPSFSARVRIEQAVDPAAQQQLSLRSILPIFAKNGHAAALGLNNRNRYDLLMELSHQPGPFAPGICNLMRPWPL